MKRLGALFRQTEFHAVLFFVFLAMTCLPVCAGNQPVNVYDKGLFFYLLGVWTGAIVLLFFIGASVREAEPPSDNASPPRD